MYGAYRWLAVNRSEWSDTTPRDESVSTSGARARLDSWVLAFGMVGEDYDNPKFAVAEVAVTFVMGLTAGIANGRMSRVGCLMWFAFATFVIFAQTVALFVYGPLLNRFLEWFIAVSTFVTAVTTLFAFLQFMGNQIDYPTAYLSLNSFQMVISVVASLLNFIAAAAVLSQFVHALRRGKSSVSGEGEKRHHMVDLFAELDLEELENLVERHRPQHPARARAAPRRGCARTRHRLDGVLRAGVARGGRSAGAGTRDLHP